MRKTLIKVAVVGSVAALALTGCSNSKKTTGGLSNGGSSGSSSGGPKQTYTIAYQGPLSGSNQALGINMDNSVKLAIEQANAKGDLPFTLKFSDSDDQGEPAQAPAASDKILQDTSVMAVVGPAFSGATAAVEPKFTAANLASVSPSATRVSLTSSGYKTFFRVVANDGAQGPAAADYLAKLGKKNVYLVDDTSDYGKGLADNIQTELKAKSVKYEREGVSDKTSDYSAIATKVVSSGADALYYGGYYAGGSLFAKALKAAGFKGLAMSDDGSNDPHFVTGAGASAAAGWQFTCACADATTDPNEKDFNAAYMTKYNVAPGTYSPEAYDATNAIISVMKGIGGTVTRAGVVAGLKSVNFQGITKPIKFESTGEVAGSTIYVYQVTGAKIVLKGKTTD